MPGVLNEKDVLKPSDYVQGAETGIVYEERTDGDWRPNRPTGERQSNKKGDTMGCTAFSALNSIEEQVSCLIREKILEGENLETLRSMGFFDENGKFNASDRFLNVVAGTTKSGNYISKIWDTIRTEGLLPEKDYPYSEDMTWEEYMQEPGVERRAKAKKVLDILDIKWERIFTEVDELKEYHRQEMIRGLKQCPLNVGVPICPGWSDSGVVTPCGKTQSEHAVIIDCIDNFFFVFDHYIPFEKSLSKYYPVPAVIKGVVTVKKPLVIKPEEKFRYKFTRKMVLGQKSNDVKMLQKALKLNGCFSVNVLETGYYGPITQEAVKKFMDKYKIGTLLERKIVNGKYTGPKTLNKLNELYDTF